ncbi:unnamed protein product [Pleuronectes platessa]|uniref:Uncharacterized protein n=1 Tax=Pleuronectes platessa TaxID=8262 RepID=A0A9N7U1S6_PLEPL|nr:unnamed protein product [Pleuronectes platessa]
MNESFNSPPCVWINDRVHSESSADVSATQGELISPVTAVRAAHGEIARHLHNVERESMELLIRTLPAHPAGPPHPRTQSLTAADPLAITTPHSNKNISVSFFCQQSLRISDSFICWIRVFGSFFT